jgi:hypothetical protein
MLGTVKDVTDKIKTKHQLKTNNHENFKQQSII